MTAIDLAACKLLEESGQLDAAYRAYVENGHHEEAARMLVSHQRPIDAADLLLAQANRIPEGAVQQERRRDLAVQAAALFEEHGRAARAVEVLVWLKSKPDLEALALRLADKGETVDGGTALARYGDPQKATAILLKTPRSDPRYAAVCVEVVRALVRGAPLTMAIDRYFAEFIRKGPDSTGEAEAFYALAALYAKARLNDNAEEVLARLVARMPDYKDAAAQKRRLERQTGETDLARVLDEDAAFDAAGRRPAPEPPPPPPEKSSPVPVAPSPGAQLSGAATLLLDDDGNAAPSSSGGPAAAAAAAAAAAQAAVVDEDEEDLKGAGIATFVPGAMIARRYLLHEIIGRGGMSIVFRAEDKELGETLALKLFTQPTSDEAIERFKQEIKLARQLIHENIIRVYDLGTALGARFLTMELLVGEDLHGKMTRGISLREGCGLLAQACAGLDTAHKLGVVHRDIKPENLFVTDLNVVKVMDFGIAKHTRKAGVTVAGMVVGTPEYMAPEQAHGHMAVTPAADLYAIGIILYALCTGQLPFRHDELVPLLIMHVQEPPRPPRLLNPGCPKEVEDLVLHLLQKRAEDRPKSALEVQQRLLGLRQRGIV